MGRLERPRPASKAGRVTLPSHPGDGERIEPIPGVEPGELSLRRRAVPSNDRRVVDGVNDGTRTRFLRAHNAVPRRLRHRSPCTRLGSNQRSPRCERGAFPLGHTCEVRRARIERATCSVSGSRSQPLSYRRLVHSHGLEPRASAVSEQRSPPELRVPVVVPGRIERPPEAFQTSALPD